MQTSRFPKASVGLRLSSVRAALLALVVAVVALLPPVPAHAIAIEFQPADTVVGVGDIFNVNVVVSDLEAMGLDEIVSAFDLDVIFDATVIAATNVTFGAFLGGGVLSFQDFALSAGRVDFSELSFIFPDDVLAATQPDTFTLATLSFQALAAGMTDLVFDPIAFPGILLVGRNAAPLTLDTVGAGTVTVQAVPEPHGVLLIAIGLLGIVAVRPRYSRRRQVFEDAR